jgi:hypothetical protein
MISIGYPVGDFTAESPTQSNQVFGADQVMSVQNTIADRIFMHYQNQSAT